MDNFPMIPKKLQGLHVLHALSFYDFYLEQFFSNRPGLEKVTFDAQVQALIEDGFATAHLTSAHLEPYGCKSTIIISNCRSAQEQWLKEHQITLPYPHEWQKQILRLQIEHYKPDVLYLNDPLTFQGDFIYSLNYKPRLILAWRAGPIPTGTLWNGFDLIVSNISGIRELAPKLGAHAAAFQTPAIPEDLFHKVSHVQPTADIVFAGQVGWGHVKRGKYINFLAETVASGNTGITGHFHISGDTNYLSPQTRSLNKGPRFGMDYFQTLRSGHICIDVRGDSVALMDPITKQQMDLAGGEGGSMRLFEGTGCGAFVLCEDFEKIEMYFERDREIVVFKDERELLEKILYFKAHPKEREDIAQRGYQRCMRDHSMKLHVERFVEIIQKYLPPVEQADLSQISTKVQTALTYLKTKESLRALETISDVITSGQTVRDAHFIRSMCFIQLQKGFEAVDDLQAELKLCPERSDVQELLDALRLGLNI